MSVISDINLLNISASDLIRNEKSMNELKSIGNANWPKDNEVTLFSHLEACERALVVEIDGVMAGYMFLSHATLHQYDLLYVGQTAISPVHHRTDAAIILRSGVIDHAREWERLNNKRLYVWFLTVNPIVYRHSMEIFEDLCPKVDGTYDEDAKNIAILLRAEKQWPHEDNPFVLRGAVAARYANEECVRMDRIIKSYSFTLFDEFGIDRSNGDRLLVICKIPQNKSIVAKL